MEVLTGRHEEKLLLEKIALSGEPELVVVYGRRRVGKTYLIRNVLAPQMAFELSGMHNATLKQQLLNFSMAIAGKAGKLKPAPPTNWMEAFNMLTTYLSPLIKKQRKVVFFDEFPWLSTARSGFMQAFEHFWNTWASRQKNLMVVICGSSAAWMIQKVINNRGGLHNRVTRSIRLQPFTLCETEAFLKARKVNLDRYQILQLYMVMGGVPQYLKEVEKGESATQAIDRTCFTKDGLLHNEFRNLFLSLFGEATNHINIIRALATHGSGLNRSGIMAHCRLSSGGGTSQILDELTESGFITPYIPFGKTSKDALYKLTDEYSRFYLKFIDDSKISGAGSWVRFSAGQSWKSWSGYAFESICMKHTRQLKEALSIGGVYSETSVWQNKGGNDKNGAQIDLLLDRQDNCINVCEMKFANSRFEITKDYARQLENKCSVFREETRTTKSLFITLVTTFGIKNIDKFPGLVQNEIPMDRLFQ
jgi:hypothetical protein